MLSSSFYKQSQARVAAEETRLSLEDASATINTLKKLLCELDLSSMPVSSGVAEFVSPRMESLIENTVLKLDALKTRVKTHLTSIETVGEYEALLLKNNSRFRLQVTAIDEEIVNAKVMDVKLRAELDELHNDLAVAKKAICGLCQDLEDIDD